MRIVFVDDEEKIISTFSHFMKLKKMENVRFFQSSKKAILELREENCDIIITDYRLQGEEYNGLEMLEICKRENLYKKAVLFSAYVDKSLLEDIINKNLISKALEKPVQLNFFHEVLTSLEQEILEEEKSLSEKIIELQNKNILELEELNSDVIGFGTTLKKVYNDLKKFSANELSIHIYGETGTGKEIIAKQVKKHGNFSGKFVPVNCGAFPEGLIESELFGYIGGAFSGASSRGKKGLIEEAENGILFLDEIAELSQAVQVKLLRFLQEGEIKPVGSNMIKKVSTKIVSATHKNLEEEVKKGNFREDLYQRLIGIVIELPPLRERIEDIPALVDFFIKKHKGDTQDNIAVTRYSIDLLKHQKWEGNIRELERVIRRALAELSYLRKTTLDVDCLSFLDFIHKSEPAGQRSDNFDAAGIFAVRIIEGEMALQDVELEVLNSILNKCGGKVYEAAARTGISTRKFYKAKKNVSKRNKKFLL